MSTPPRADGRIPQPVIQARRRLLRRAAGVWQHQHEPRHSAPVLRLAGRRGALRDALGVTERLDIDAIGRNARRDQHVADVARPVG